MLTECVTTEVQPWYWQFYLRRGNADWASDQISSEGHEAHLECISGFVYVGTWTYGSRTTVTIELHEQEPRPDGHADHVEEVVLDEDGQLAILNWEPNDVPVAEIHLPTGQMTLRGSSTDVRAANEFSERETGGDQPSPERILIQIWPLIDDPEPVLIGGRPEVGN